MSPTPYGATKSCAKLTRVVETNEFLTLDTGQRAMSKPIFVPTATPVENVGFTPDPVDPHGWPPGLPEGERPFDLRPEFPLHNERAFFRFCNLSLRAGCYQLFLNRTDVITPFSDRFEGTMRVEIGSGDTTVSGDLYKARPFDDQVIGQVNKVFAAPQPFIPIKPRNRYFSYLRVVGISGPPVITTQLARFGPIVPPIFNFCTITLTVEEFRYTHPTAGQATGSFPGTPTRTLVFVLSKAAVPAGFPGPAFEGDVFENGVRLPLKVSLVWVSTFFRRAHLELENVTGVAIPGNVGANSFRSTFAKAGWDLTVVQGDTNIALPGGVSPSWSRAELHAFMLANRNPAANLDREWHTYHVSVPLVLTPDSAFGVMFDQIADEREGACSFIQAFTGIHNDNRARLRSAIHEMGHVFNQLHLSGENLADDNSIMTPSLGVLAVIQGAGGTYPDDINFAFNAHNRHHLIHAPDVVVRPGGEDFTFGHGGGFAPEAQDDAKARGIALRVAASDERLQLGQPLIVKVELVNGGAKPVSVPAIFGTDLHNVSIVVRRAGREERRIRSFVLICHEDLYRDLAPGKSITWEEVVYWDRNGVVFPDPGRYVVSVEARWFERGQPLAAEAFSDVWVDYPLTEKDNAVAAALLDDEVGKYVALGGNAVHLKRAVARIAEAKRVEPKHPAIHRIAQIDARGREINKKRSAGKKRRK